jgi:uncharacterized protein
MVVQIKQEKDYKTSTWSGGNTTELMIYPPEGSYQNQDFLFRISSATVLEEESTFTKLPGVRRNLLVLEGKIKLTHNDSNGYLLSPFEQGAFLGDWDTKSEGKVVDFNLMMKEGAEGKVEPIQLPPKDKENLVVYLGDNKVCFLILYVYEGQITIEDGYEKQIIKEKELAVIEIHNEIKVSGFVIENPLDSKVKFIKTEVYI